MVRMHNLVSEEMTIDYLQFGFTDCSIDCGKLVLSIVLYMITYVCCNLSTVHRLHLFYCSYIAFVN